jgi:hypothetical protein
MKLIPVDWYFQSPIDFEHKQYILYAYLQEVDSTYLNKKVSPHLLHLEKLEEELINFQRVVKDTEHLLEKQKYFYFEDIHRIGEKLDVLSEIQDIVDFSIPQIKSRIQTGYKIAAKYKQLLY